ncbi:hypothetical protein GCM10008018_44860 [Paenibacillus marchantiophytorum]|uniref:Uncharacterized protein n=1 Tax=Paenibacillus marchantiophytorum TaxID=1619310 RepID=A0ABQ1EYL5_9BACL|nr:hypothetical protein [Paenibacillus marchantiophytorum]GFZ93452.1 hypothetical protein GCM10008018_44860 [Paenibacillus marchantiophytorum]
MIIKKSLDLNEIITQLGINPGSYEKWKASENFSSQSIVPIHPSIQPFTNPQIPYSQAIKGWSSHSVKHGLYEE